MASESLNLVPFEIFVGKKKKENVSLLRSKKKKTGLAAVFSFMIDGRPNGLSAARRDPEIAGEKENEREAWDWREEKRKKRSWLLSQSRLQSPQVENNKQKKKKQDKTVYGERRKNTPPLQTPVNP